ncbi:MAG TPA: FoF1 ATP synthase subunit gamma [Sulfuricella sp.]|nr:FoF1 ATP synthase subunit gamma [Sulfuricella sp.]
MSRRRDLQQRLGSLDEIEGIMVAMKNLAFMETRKLAQFLSTQQRAVTSIEAAASDFASHYRHALPRPGSLSEVYLLIGSERGFCGDFNESVAQEMFSRGDAPPIVAVGRRLEPILSQNPALLELVEGPSATEEVAPVLTGLADRLAEIERNLRPGTVLGLTVFYHSDETGGVRARRLLPLPEPKPPGRAFSHPPLLNLAPTDFFAGLTEHYLYAALHEAFYSSLMVENRYRLDHMENAIRQLDKRVSRLKLAYNTMRQEEIIEEIEVIMLSVEALGKQP